MGYSTTKGRSSAGNNDKSNGHASSNGVATNGADGKHSNGKASFKAAAAATSNGTPAQSESKKHNNSTFTLPRVLSALGSILRSITIDVPLSALFILLVASVLIRHTYHTHVLTIVDAYRRGQAMDSGFYPDFNNDMTYYNRICDKYDITTRDANDLFIHPDYTGDQAADIMMKHGAVVVPNVLKTETAAKLRVYLESRHKIQDELPWHEKFFEEIDRLALGLGAGDDPIVTEAIRQVGTNPLVKTTVEGILGPDPAVVEISTMTSLAGAEDQGIHTDSDFFGSSLLYSRTFLHSYTMFISLQNTTARMGATTLCPGTHHCANPDMEEICLENGAFEASSNGLTGPDRNDGRGGGVLLQGDAMMFNQNVWHRGAANQDPNNPDSNRVMFILTFVTRNKANKRLADRRYQGLGTYYYQRWNMWGHTYQDLKDAGTVMRQPVAALRSMGIWKPKNRHWGVTWIEHMARELGNREHFYDNYELPDLVKFLDKIAVPKFLQGEYGRTRKRSLMQWEPFLEEVMDNVVDWLIQLNVIAVATYLIIRFVIMALGWIMSTAKNMVARSSTGQTTSMSQQQQTGYVRAILESMVPVIGSVALFGFVCGLYLQQPGKALLKAIGRWRLSDELEAFMEDKMGDAADILVFVTGATVGAYLVARVPRFISGSKTSDGEKRHLLPSFLERIVLSHSLVALVALGSALYLEQTDLFMSAKTKEIFKRPFAPVHGRVKHDTPTTFPERVDILVGTRFDAEYLASFNRMLDYHPGNIRFNDMVAGFAKLPPSMTDVAARTILEFVQERTEGMTPRFLLQSYADGYWMVMSSGDALELTKKAIAMERDGLTNALGREIKSILADSRFGILRETVLASRFTPAFVNKWEAVIFGSAKVKSGDVSAPLVSGTKSSSGGSPPTLRIWPMATIPISDAARNKSAAPHHKQRYLMQDLVRKANDPMAQVLKVGDKVLGFFDDTNSWEEARIEVVQDPFTCELLYHDGEYYVDTKLDEMREFEPFQEGDKVMAQFEETETWHKGTITMVHPLGTYDISYDDGDKEWGKRRELIQKPKRLVKPISRLLFDTKLLPTYEVGDEVMVNFRGDGQFYQAEIVGVNGDGTYDVEYTDGSGDVESGVERSMIVDR